MPAISGIPFSLEMITFADINFFTLWNVNDKHFYWIYQEESQKEKNFFSSSNAGPMLH